MPKPARVSLSAVPKLRSIQALRAIAALLVVVQHLSGYETRFSAGRSLSFLASLHNLGRLGVEMFFVISGFIMITTNWNEFGSAGAPTRFLLRRILRIVPPYWIITLLILPLFLKYPHLVNSSSKYRSDVLASLLLLPQAGPPLLLVGWTLVFEMYFYYVFTVTLNFSRRYLGWTIAAWLALMLALDVLVYPRWQTPYISVVAGPINLLFIVGIVVGYLTMNGHRAAAWPLAISGAVATPLLFALHDHLIAYKIPYVDQWVGILITGAAIAMLIFGLVQLEHYKGLVIPGLLVLVGDASYALYLWHVPTLSVFARLTSWLPVHSMPVRAAWVIAGLFFATWVAILVYRFVERPILKNAERALHLLRTSPATFRT